jgi:ABC-type phosphate transport system permease subunit
MSRAPPASPMNGSSASPGCTLASPQRPAWGFSLTRALSIAFSVLALGTVFTMLAVFVVQSLPLWHHAGLEFVSGTRWFYRTTEFGALPMLYGTIVVALIALLLTAPIGIGAAIFATELIHPRLRLMLKIAVELLAGIPSVIYGLHGAFKFAAAGCALLACGVLVLIIFAILRRGLPAMHWSFFTEQIQLVGAAGGIFYNLVGTLILIGTALLVSTPGAVGLTLVHGVYLHHHARRERLAAVLYLLNGMPSILFGLFGLIVFVKFLGWGKS